MKSSSISLAVVFICFFQILFVDANLLDDECPRTPNPDLCFSSLRPYYQTHDPSSLREMAIVLGSTVLVNSVYATIDKINELIKEYPTYQVLNQCKDNFDQIRDNNIRGFREAMVKSDYNAAQLATYPIAGLAVRCSSALSKGYSDLINRCLQVTDLSKDLWFIVMAIK